MIDSGPVLQAYADLILRFSRAGSVTFALFGLGDDLSPSIRVRGDLAPVDELRDEAALRKLRERLSAHDPVAIDEGTIQIESAASDCVLFRMPALRSGVDAARKVRGRSRQADRCWTSAPAVWIGLRFPPGVRGFPRRTAPIEIPFDAGEAAGEGWWQRILGLAAALASHGHAVDRLVHDPLTKLPSRLGFHTELGLELEQARSTRRPLALLLANPDDYAKINARFGRATGDAVVAEIAQRLRRLVRATDRVARYGGAMFSVVLADVEPDAAERLAEKIRRGLEERAYGSDSIRLAFSVGLTCVGPDAADEVNVVGESVRRADHALFRAKCEGGARSRTWTRDSAEGEICGVDRLQGIFTCDANVDYRNMALLWEVVQSIAGAGDAVELCRQVADHLHTWLSARVVAIVELDGAGQPRIIAARANGDMPSPDWTLDTTASKLVARATEAGKEIVVRPGDAAAEAAGSARAVPLIAGDRRVGCLYLEETETTGRDAPDSRFLAALAAQLAIALDRAQTRTIERTQDAERQEILESEVSDLRRVLHSTRLSYASKSMQDVIDTARRVAPTDATVLITGESGTGKELLARTVHQLGDRRDRPLIIVDCGAISASLVDSELFGHEKGAFTGAHVRKTGRLAEADGATVFLDEIGELPIDAQSKLLRFVQERQITPVGSTRPTMIDARILAATNVDLAERVRDGTFREDLYHRLNVIHLRLPPLRERKQDILHLASLFLQQYASLYRKNGLRLSPEAGRALLDHSWTGNVRELQNRVMRAVLFCDEDALRPEHFEGPGDPAPVFRATSGCSAQVASTADAAEEPEAALLAALSREIDLALQGGRARPLGKWLEADLIIAADRATHGVARQAGALLGLPDTTYRRRLNRAARERQAGQDVRSQPWDSVTAALERLVSTVSDARGDVAARVERMALDAIAVRCNWDTGTGAVLLGVTEATYLKRLAAHGVGPVPA